MYVEYFKLTRLPFVLNPDVHFVFRSQEQVRASAAVLAESARPGGCLTVIGAAGVGKTLLLEHLRTTCPRDLLIAQVNYPLESTSELLQAVLSQLDGAAAVSESQDLFRVFSGFLARHYAGGRKVLLTVDEAHGLARPVLASLLQLADCGTPYSGDLRIIIAGEPELEGVLAAAARDRRVPRLCEEIRLRGLTRSEVGPYIEHRLSLAGAPSEPLFARDTFDLIYRYTAGNPRRINVLCDTAMSIACARNLEAVTPVEIRDAASELHWTVEVAADQMPQEAAHSETRASVQAPVGAPNGARPRLPAVLYVNFQGKPIAHLVLTEGQASIGRAPGNDLQIVSEFVSRYHCQVITTQDGSMIEDVSSTNGVYMQSQRVRRYRLRDGDVLNIGDHELHYTELPRASESPAA
jgi:general secretion pathway protein A